MTDDEEFITLTHCPIRGHAVLATIDLWKSSKIHLHFRRRSMKAS